MVKKAKGKHRLDKYYHLAKEQGYRSRAAFKLVQLNRKYHFLEGSRALLDLCAAPGGWLQVCAKQMPMGSQIIGIDLVPIRPVRGCKTIVGDITTQQARQAIKKEANGAMMDAVIHDGAPNVGGAWASEAYSQSALVLEALRIATDFLAPRGTFVTKVFRSQDYNALLYACGQLFGKVDATKPTASRNTSAEIFVVCQGYRAPAKIDPRLLDPKHLFKDVTEAPRSLGPEALLRSKVKQKRHRSGYEEGLSLMHRPAPAGTFVLSEAPVEMLGQHSQLVLEGPGSEVADHQGLAAFVRSHPATAGEASQLCADLQVLGRGEFKALLKWRLMVRKAWELQQSEAAAQVKAELSGEDAAEGAAGEQDSDVEEDKLLAEMTGTSEKLQRRLKREKRRRKELKTKARVRAAQLAQSEGINQDASNEPLFSLSALPTGSVAALGEAPAPAQGDLAAMEAGSEDDSPAPAPADEADDSDDERRQYEAAMEQNMDELYQAYLRRRGQRAEADRAKRQRLGQAGELEESEDDEAGSRDDAAKYQPPEDSDDEDVAMQQPGAGLLVRLDERRAGRPATSAAVAAQWFAQDVFAGAEDAADEPADDHAAAAAAQQQQSAAAQQRAWKGAAEQPAAPAGQLPKREAAAAAAGALQAPA